MYIENDKVGEMALQVKVLAALLENTNSVPSTHIGQFTSAGPGNMMPSSGRSVVKPVLSPGTLRLLHLPWSQVETRENGLYFKGTPSGPARPTTDVKVTRA